MADTSPSAPNITMTELRRAKWQLEADIFVAVNSAVLKFRETTGLMPQAINIEISRNDTAKGVSYLPTGVSAEVKIS